MVPVVRSILTILATMLDAMVVAIVLLIESLKGWLMIIQKPLQVVVIPKTPSVLMGHSLRSLTPLIIRTQRLSSGVPLGIWSSMKEGGSVVVEWIRKWADEVHPPHPNLIIPMPITINLSLIIIPRLLEGGVEEMLNRQRLGSQAVRSGSTKIELLEVTVAVLITTIHVAISLSTPQLLVLVLNSNPIFLHLANNNRCPRISLMSSIKSDRLGLPSMGLLQSSNSWISLVNTINPHLDPWLFAFCLWLGFPPPSWLHHIPCMLIYIYLSINTLLGGKWMPNQLYVYHPHPSAYLFVGLDDNSIGLRHKKGSLCKSQKKTQPLWRKKFEYIYGRIVIYNPWFWVDMMDEIRVALILNTFFWTFCMLFSLNTI